MDQQIVISAMSGLFPGAHGPASLSDFSNNIKCAKPAKVCSLETKWKVPRNEYFSSEPGSPYRTYCDLAFVLSDDASYSQLRAGRQVIRDLFASVAPTELPAPSRIGLCLGTMWCDESYFNEDLRAVLGPYKTHIASTKVLGPDKQIQEFASEVNLEGPCLAIDTACASSLYALDTAIALISHGRADAVAVMGLNVFLPMFLYLGFATLRALTATGKILPFSKEAAGIIPAEAAAAILVEPLEQSLRCGREPLAVIGGLGLSSDGGDRSVFAPSPLGQRLAYERAYGAVDPAGVQYVEAHGTATVLGDQTEIETLDGFFGPYMKRRRLPIGSAKALVGHTLAAAGMVSTIKALLMIRDRFIAPLCAFEPNPKLAESCLSIPATKFSLNPQKECSIAVSSFGFGGANAHLVLRSPDAYKSVTNSTRSVVSIPLAIVAAEASMGAAHGIADISDAVKQTNSSQRLFPAHRFPNYAGPLCEGSFFPDKMLIEGEGMKMGPVPLSRLDPFQRLGCHVSQKVLKEQNQKEETAIVFCTNLGGETGLQLSRHYQAHFSGDKNPVGSYADLEPRVETIASSLASLTSGFVSYQLGLRGFHQTVSGGSATFWEMFGLAQYWLQHRCESLVIAAGRHIKSPLDFQGTSFPPGEGVAAFLLKTPEQCTHTGEQPLAIVRFVFSGQTQYTDTAQSLQAACEKGGIEFTSICSTEISQLTESKEAALGSAQRVFGFLDEATGAEALLKILLRTGTGMNVIQLCQGNRIVANVFIEKLRDMDLSQNEPRTPLPIKFQSRSCVPEPEQLSQTPATEETKRFLAWQHGTETALIRYLEEQRKLIELLGGEQNTVLDSINPASLENLRKNPKDLVLTSLNVEAKEADNLNASARLIVDETHPYFFDHMLDHVPGILMLEGVLQLTESLISTPLFLSSVDLAFKHFCEKDRPTFIQATSTGRIRSSFSVLVNQSGREVAVGRICTLSRPESPTPFHSQPFLPSHQKLADPRYVHKTHQDNVLITDLLTVRSGSVYSCDLLPPQRNHILDDGPDDSYSLLYLLETTRQFAMLVGHKLSGIPLGMPMNLTSIKIKLTRPVPRRENLRFVCGPQPIYKLGAIAMAEFALNLIGPLGTIGESTIKAQIVTQETYLKQRKLQKQG